MIAGLGEPRREHLRVGLGRAEDENAALADPKKGLDEGMDSISLQDEDGDEDMENEDEDEGEYGDVHVLEALDKPGPLGIVVLANGHDLVNVFVG